MMRLLFVADGRSPIALNWMRYFVAQGYEVHLASTFDCQPDLDLASLSFIPVAFSAAKRAGKAGAAPARRGLLWSSAMVGVRTAVRQWLGPATLSAAAQSLQALVRRVQPQGVHAMRIPYEGMLAALALSDSSLPLLLSTWGNDFSLHAPSNPWMARLTTTALKRATALHADCARDVRLAHAWGFPVGRPATILPGAGGVQTDLFYPSHMERPPLIVNPRGIRAYVRTDTFFKAIPLILEQFPTACFACPAMTGEKQAETWVQQLGISTRIQLLPRLTRPEMADLFRQAQVTVSPSTHDGTPNTLLEGMACGSFPIAGDLESLREWITPGINGLLVDPGSPERLAQAVLLALQKSDLRAAAESINQDLIQRRAAYETVMPAAERFYQTIFQP